MNKDLFIKITEAIKEELLDEKQSDPLRNLKNRIRRDLNTKPIMDAVDDLNKRTDLVTKGAKMYKSWKAQFDSKKIKSSNFDKIDEEEKKKALEYLGKRLEAFKIALEADEPSEIEAAKPALDKFEKSDDTPIDVKDIPVEDMYDPSEEDKKELVSAYEAFRDGFYQAKKRTEQGALIQGLINILTKVQKAQKQDKESAAAFQRMDEQEKQRVKKELQNVKTDVASFYQEILRTRKLLTQAGAEARAGKINFRVVKEKFTDQLEEIQEDIVEIYNDLINLSPPKATVQQVSEQEENEQEDGPGVRQAKNVQAAYDFVTKTLGKLMNRMISKDPVSEKVLIPAVDQALEKLDKIADIFPSVRAFSGQTGTFSDLEIQYNKMIKDMGYLNDSFQELIKDEDTSSYTIKRLHRGLKKFSKEIEKIFGVESKIEGKPDPTSDEAEPIEPETGDTVEPGEEPAGDDAGEKEKKETELRSIDRAETFIKDKIFPLDKYMQIFDDNPEAQGFAEDSRDVLGLFLALSKARQEVNEQEEVAMGQESLSRVITFLSKIFNVPQTKTEYIINQQLRKIVPNKLKTLSQFLTMVRREGQNSELVRLARFIQNRIKAFPFTVTVDPSQLMRKFDIEDSKAKPQEKGEETPQQAQDAEAEQQGEDLTPDEDRVVNKFLDIARKMKNLEERVSPRQLPASGENRILKILGITSGQYREAFKQLDANEREVFKSILKNKAKGKSFFKRLKTKPEKSTFDQYVDMIATKVEPFVQREYEKVKKVVKQENPKADKEEIKDEVEEKIDVEEVADEVIEDIAEENPSIPDEDFEKYTSDAVKMAQKELDKKIAELELEMEKTFGPDISNYKPRDKKIAEVFRMIGPNLKRQGTAIRDIMEEIPDMNLENSSELQGFIQADLLPVLDGLMQKLGRYQLPIVRGEAKYRAEDLKNTDIYKFIFNRLNPKLLDVFDFQIVEIPFGAKFNSSSMEAEDGEDVEEKYVGRVLAVHAAGLERNGRDIRAPRVIVGK
jgi:hypothetical protein